MMTRPIRVLTSIASAVLATLLLVAPAYAECGGFDTWPAFTETVPSAKRVFVGTVTASHDGSGDNAIRFSLRVDEVLRGTADPTMEIEIFQTGIPLTCGDSMLRVRVGDRIAFALDIRVNGVDHRVNTVAFLNRNPDDFLMPGVERLSLSQVRALAGLPPTDAVAAGRDFWVPTALALFAFAAAGFLAWGLRGRAPQ